MLTNKIRKGKQGDVLRRSDSTDPTIDINIDSGEVQSTPETEGSYTMPNRSYRS